MDEEAKAVQEVAKATSKAIDASQKVGSFLSTFIKGPLEQGIGIFEDKLKYIRWERQQRLIERGNAFLRERGMTAPTRAVPMKIVIPIAQQGSMEEDNDLQDRWALLLVNAGDEKSGVEVRPAFLSILQDLSPIDALILDKIYSVPLEEIEEGIRTAFLPDRVVLEKTGAKPETALPNDATQLSLRNLLRLGLIDSAMTWGGAHSVSLIHQTILGHQFMKACGKRISS